ncbi:MAG: flagellar hook-basal body complex protein FliE [Thermodesulfobacteriota bacterium]
MKVMLPPGGVNSPLTGLDLKPLTSGQDTGNAFQKMLNDVNAQQSQADTKSRQTLLGQEELHEATLSLEKASLSLKLLVQVRNKMIQAYEELIRMPL